MLGNALLDSVGEAMRALIVDLLAGDFQVKERDRKEQLSLFGGFGLGSADIGDIPACEEVEEALLAVDGVQTVHCGEPAIPGDLVCSACGAD